MSVSVPFEMPPIESLLLASPVKVVPEPTNASVSLPSSTTETPAPTPTKPPATPPVTPRNVVVSLASRTALLPAATVAFEPVSA